MRDGDDTQKKKWFSRKKKPTLSPTTVSRPPSTASFGSTRRKFSSLRKSLDDDLPARESTGTPPRQDTNPHSTDSSDGQSSTADIPVHAGFDLKAIKDMIGESEENPEELQVPQFSRIDTPPVLSQSNSTPPNSDNRTVSARTPTESPMPVAPHADWSATFATSLSLHNGPDVGDDSQGMLPVANDLGSQDDPIYASSAAPHTSTIPQISFGGNEGSIWSPPSLEKRSPAFVNTFTTNPVSFGDRSGSIRSSSISHDTYSPETSSSASLSFGGADGTITLQDMGQGPWNIPAGDSKKTPSYLSNPWST